MTPKDDLSNWDLPDSDETDPFELLDERRADGGPAAQGQAAAPVSSEPGGAAPARRPAWEAGALLGGQTLGRFWAALLGASAIGAVCLQIAGPPIRHADPAPTLPETTAMAMVSQPMPAPVPNPVPAASVDAPQAEITPPQSRTAAPAFPPAAPEPDAPAALQTSPPVVSASPASPEPAPETARRALETSPPGRKQAGGSDAPHLDLALAARKQATTPGDVPPVNADPGPPSLLIHYPSGSPEAATDAQRLAANADPGSRNTVAAAQGNPPAVATIKYFDAKDHASARAMGKSLQQLGYRWRIERGTEPAGQPPAAVEVWMPLK